MTFVALTVANLEDAVSFYRLVLGDVLHESNHDAELDDPWYGGPHAAATWTDGAFLHFAVYPEKPPQRRAGTGAQVGFHVSAFDDVEARLARSGATVVQPARDEPWVRTARYLDPDGNVVSITARDGR